MALKSLRFSCNIGYCSILFWLCLSTACGKPVDLSPAWQNEISQQASSYAQHVALPFMMKELDDLHVPGLSGVAKTPLGKVKYRLDHIKISDVDIKTANISLDHGLTMRADKASFKVGADWKYKENTWPHISDAGSCMLSIGDLSLELSFAINKGGNSSNATTLRVHNCNLKIGSLKIKFNGGASWLYNLFSGIISKDIKNQLQSHICDSAVKLIDTKANQLLDTMPGISQTLKMTQ